MQKTRNNTKESTLQLRISTEQKNLLSQAAKLRTMTLSGFVLERAFSTAEEVLTEQSHFFLTPEQWDTFCKAIDEPARTLVELKNLMNEDSVLDG